MRTGLRIVMGLAAACLTAAVVKVAHVMTPADFVALSASELGPRLARFADLVALTATHQALFVVPLALIAVTVAELNRLRSWLTYALLGAAIASAGWYLQYVSEGELRTIANAYAARAYLIEGMLAGWVYWLFAGRFAGWRRGGGLVRTQPLPVSQPRLRISDVPANEPSPAKMKVR